MAAADLNDALWGVFAHHGVMRGGIEPWKPVLLKSRLGRFKIVYGKQGIGVTVDACKKCLELIAPIIELRFQPGIALLLVTFDTGCPAVRYKEPAATQA